MKYGPPRSRSRSKLGYPAAAGVLALSAAGFVGAAAFPAAAAEDLCGTVDLAPTGSGQWNVQNNNYSQTGEQCVTPTADGFTVDKAAGEIAPGGAPKSYPSLVAGCHWGRCTDTPGLPLKAADIGAARTGVDITPVKDGSWNAAYDLWFDKNPDAQGQNEGTELMIWVNGNDAPDPIGKVVSTVDIAGASWTVWQGNIGWDVISFVREQPATAVDLPLEPFVTEAIERGATEPDDWMTSVQVGFEPWKGGEGLAMKNFTLDLDGAPATDDKTPDQDQGEDRDAGESQDQPGVDQDVQDQPAPGGDQDQAREQPSALAPTRARAVEDGEQPRPAPAPAESTAKAPDAPSEPTRAPEPTASEKTPQAPPVEPAPAGETDDAQRDPAPQPAAPTAEADQPEPEPKVPAPAPTTAPVEQDQGGQQRARQGEQDQREQAGDRFVLVAGEPDGEQDDQGEPSEDEGRAYREVDVDGRDAAWSLGWGTHSVSGTARVTNLPRGEQVTIAALHDADSQALAIAIEQVEGNTALVVKVNGTSKGLPVLEADYQVGQAFDFELEIVDGAPQVRLAGDLVYEGELGDIVDSGENYWKTGPGAQATSNGDGQGQHAEVELSDLSITHESASATAERSEQTKREAPSPQRTRPTTTPSTQAKEAARDPALTSGSAPKPQRPDDGYAPVAARDDPALLITAPGQGKSAGKTTSGAEVADLANPKREVTVHGDVGATTTPDGSTGAVLDGRSGYLQVEDSPDLSIATTGQLSVEMLLRPDKVANLPSTQDSSEGAMVQPLVKGSTFGSGGDQEWAMRLYPADSGQRAERTSAYAFDPAGGQGAGAYAQHDLVAGRWVHLTAVYDTTTGDDEAGTVTFYRDGLATDSDTLGGDYDITPTDGDSPLFIGGDPEHSLFTGAIGAVAIYPTALSATQIAAHANAALHPDAAGKDTGKDDEGKSKDAGKSEESGEDVDQGRAGTETGAGTSRPIPIPTQPTPTIAGKETGKDGATS